MIDVCIWIDLEVCFCMKQVKTVIEGNLYRCYKVKIFVETK